MTQAVLGIFKKLSDFGAITLLPMIQMSPQLLAAVIGLIGLIIGAIPTYAFMRQRKLAELDKLNAETDKIRAEAGKIRAEFNLIAPTQPYRVSMLFVAANPMVLSGQLRLGEEIRGIAHGFRSSKHEAAFHIEQLWGARWQDLRRQMLRDAPEIVHFAGNASDVGLSFEDEAGGMDVISGEQFTALMSLFSDRVRLVFLNANVSEELCSTLAKAIDFVVGPCQSLADQDAIKFAAAFYEALADGVPVPAAFDFAQASLSPAGEGKAYRLFSERRMAEPHLLPKQASKE